MIGAYCNQQITIKRRTGVDENNKPTYTTGTIKARFEYVRRMVRNSRGETVASEAALASTAPVAVGDVIVHDGREWPIIAISNGVTLGGKIAFWEARL